MKNHDKVKPVFSLSLFFTIKTGQDNVGLNDGIGIVAIFSHKQFSGSIGFFGIYDFSAIKVLES